MDSLLQDLRYSVRQLARSRGFTIIAVLSLALGIGANSTIFSVANAFLIAPVHAKDPGSLVRIYRNHHSPLNYREYAFLRDKNTVFSHFIAERMTTVGMSGAGDSEKRIASMVNGEYFNALGLVPAAGRLFRVEGDRVEQSEQVAVLSHRFWSRRFASDPGIVGQTIRLNNQPFTVIGVGPEGFESSVFPWNPDVFIPFTESRSLLNTPLDQWGGSLYMTARLKPGVSRAQAETELKSLNAALLASDPDINPNKTLRLDHVRGINAEMRLPVTAAATLLMTVVGLVLLIACANIANLLLARATTRRREISIRLAIGAGRWRLVRQLLTESVLLALIGGAIGLLITAWTVDLVKVFLSPDLPIALDLSPDRRVLAFTIALSLLTGVLFGLVPALRATSPDIVSAIKDEASARGYRRSRLRNTLVIGQVTLCMVLLIGASLFVRSLSKARQIDPGFDPSNIAVLPIDLGLQQYSEERGREYFRRLVENVEALPGVKRATLAELVPLAFSNQEVSLWTEGEAPRAPNQRVSTYFNRVGPGYFEMLRMPIVRGREFTAADVAGSTSVTVINEEFARRFWPGQNPIGKRLSWSGPEGPFFEVVGVARNAKYNTLGEAVPAFQYVPSGQQYQPEMFLHVETTGNPRSSLIAIRNAALAIDPSLPIGPAKTMSQEMQASLIPAQAGASVLGTFGLLALLLGAVGIYGVTSYVVAQRTRELGIRTALGAQRRDLLRMVIRESMTLVTIGLSIGLLAALGLGRLLSSLLYGISSADPVTFGLTPLILASIALMACWVPARRATRVDPMVALRSE
jgi:predicted permease